MNGKNKVANLVSELNILIKSVKHPDDLWYETNGNRLTIYEGDIPGYFVVLLDKQQ